jgi:hypothetical protein
MTFPSKKKQKNKTNLVGIRWSPSEKKETQWPPSGPSQSNVEITW